LYYLPYRIAGTIVGNDHFEVPAVLPYIALQQGGKCVGPIIGSNDNSDLQCGLSIRGRDPAKHLFILVQFEVCCRPIAM